MTLPLASKATTFTSVGYRQPTGGAGGAHRHHGHVVADLGVAGVVYGVVAEGRSLPYALQEKAPDAYSVVVTNVAGRVTSCNAVLTVIVPPTLALDKSDCKGRVFPSWH